LLTQTGVDGKDVVQLGCNNGRESLSLFALGARSVVGVDQSGAFLEQARELASRSPHAPQFIEADTHHLPAQLQERFDLALITIGVLNWMPDIGEFFRHVARTLKPGGALVVYETHPFLEMFDPEAVDPFRLASSYSVVLWADTSCQNDSTWLKLRRNGVLAWFGFDQLTLRY
jgi:ubiquinone/menaquinone biosynthesis C-methylase UbiE